MYLMNSKLKGGNWMFRFLKKLFGQSENEQGGEQVQEMVAPVEEKKELTLESPLVKKELKQANRRETQITLSSNDLMQMAQKLKAKGEYYRAEQLIRDGVKGATNNPDLWWLLLEIEEPLNRKGRAYYCVEQIVQMEPENEKALEKLEELQPYIDEQLNYFIEYKMAPEFYRLK